MGWLERVFSKNWSQFSHCAGSNDILLAGCIPLGLLPIDVLRIAPWLSLLDCQSVGTTATGWACGMLLSAVLYDTLPKSGS